MCEKCKRIFLTTRWANGRIQQCKDTKGFVVTVMVTGEFRVEGFLILTAHRSSAQLKQRRSSLPRTKKPNIGHAPGASCYLWQRQEKLLTAVTLTQHFSCQNRTKDRCVKPNTWREQAP